MKNLEKVIFGTMHPVMDSEGNIYEMDNFRQVFNGLRVSVFIFKDDDDPGHLFIKFRNDRIGKGLKTYASSAVYNSEEKSLVCRTGNSVYWLTECSLCADFADI